jgi:hypothetical protein
MQLRRSVAALIWTKARRMLDSASTRVGGVRAKSRAEAFDQAGHGVDGQRGLAESRRLGAEVDGGELVQPMTWLTTTVSAGTSASRRERR